MKNDQLKNLWRIYCFAFLLSVITVLILNIYKIEKPNHDLWFEKFSINWIKNNTPVVKWDNHKNADLITIFNLQKGIYYNWRPVGYSLFLVPAIKLSELINTDFPFVRTIYQLIIFSSIPAFLYLFLLNFFRQLKDVKIISISIAILFTLNPTYLVSSMQSLDTNLITLLTLLVVLLLFQQKNNNPKSYIYVIILLIFLFFTKPIAIFPFFSLLIILLIIGETDFKKNYVIILTFVSLFIITWGFRNYHYFGTYDITNTSVGYNLWLGNNQHTNEFLRMHLGDGSTIEDKIIPKYDEKWKFLSTYNEYEKDKFFKLHAWQFIKDYPLVTVENMFWKLIGFWSPLRVRDGHWSDSSLKKYLVLMFYTPLLILSLLSVIRFFWYKEYRIRKEKGLLILFMFLWMLPHLMFFSTARFRAPIDFGLYILAADVVLNYFTNIKKISS